MFGWLWNRCCEVGRPVVTIKSLWFGVKICPSTLNSVTQLSCLARLLYSKLRYWNYDFLCICSWFHLQQFGIPEPGMFLLLFANQCWLIMLPFNMIKSPTIWSMIPDNMVVYIYVYMCVCVALVALEKLGQPHSVCQPRGHDTNSSFRGGIFSGMDTPRFWCHGYLRLGNNIHQYQPMILLMHFCKAWMPRYVYLHNYVFFLGCVQYVSDVQNPTAIFTRESRLPTAAAGTLRLVIVWPGQWLESPGQWMWYAPVTGRLVANWLPTIYPLIPVVIGSPT